MNNLYLPSTPLNLLLSCAHAVAHREQRNALWMIDQKPHTNNPYFKALKAWKETVFSQINILFKAPTLLDKTIQRKQNFKRIHQWLDSFEAQRIFTSNDRHLEFQYTLHHLHKTGHITTGIYLDDGLYSYLDMPIPWHSWAANQLVKNIAYGLWWQQPRHVGSSKLIEESWLFSPESATPSVKRAGKTHTIEPTWFQHPAMYSLGEHILNEFQCSKKQIDQLHYLILLSHPSNIKNPLQYQKNLSQLFKTLKRKHQFIGVKYHPRHSGNDPLDLLQHGADYLLPSQLGIEFILPYAPSKLHLIGDVSSALLICRWLNENLKISALLNQNAPSQTAISTLYRKFSIEVFDNFSQLPT